MTEKTDTSILLSQLSELKSSCSKDWPNDQGFRETIKEAQKDLLLLTDNWPDTLANIPWPENCICVEFGCGSAVSSLLLARHAKQVTAFDPYLENLSVAERIISCGELGHRVHLQQQFSPQCVFPSNSVDVVVAIRNTASHELDLVLSESNRILKPGGLLVFGTPTPHANMAKLLQQLGDLDMASFTEDLYKMSQTAIWRAGVNLDPKATRCYSKEELKSCLSFYGFHEAEETQLSIWPNVISVNGGCVYCARKTSSVSEVLDSLTCDFTANPEKIKDSIETILAAGLPLQVERICQRLPETILERSAFQSLAAIKRGQDPAITALPNNLDDSLKQHFTLAQALRNVVLKRDALEPLVLLADKKRESHPLLTARAYLTAEMGEAADETLKSHLHLHSDDLDAWCLRLQIAFEKRDANILSAVAIDCLEALAVQANIDNAETAKLKQSLSMPSTNYATSAFLHSKEDPLDGHGVLHGRMEIAGNINRITTHLRRRGVRSRGLNYYDNWLEMNVDYQLHLNRKLYSKGTRRKQALDFVVQKLMAEYDIFHFHFGGSFYDDYRDLEELKSKGKKLVFSYWGSDVRSNEFIMYTQARYMGFKPPKPYYNSLAQYGMLKRINEYADVLLASTCIPRGLFFPGVVDPADWTLQDKEEILKKQIIKKDPNKTYFVHAPTRKWVKGSHFIMKALEELKKEGLPIEVLYIHKMLPEKAREMYAYADVAIDQISVGTFGLFAMEMFCWKIPVMVYETSLFARIKENAPIVNITHATIKDQIRSMVEMKQKGELEELGTRCREYATTVTNIETSMPLYINMYRTLLEGKEVEQIQNPSWYAQAEKLERFEKNEFYRYMHEEGIFRALGIDEKSIEYDKRIYY